MKTKTHSYLPSLAVLFSVWLMALVLHASTVVEPWYQPSKQYADSEYDDATLNKIKAIKVSVHWDNISLKAALDNLNSQSKLSDPSQQGIQFLSKLPSEDQKVSMTLEDESLLNVLGYLAEQAGFRVKIHKSEVILLPLKEPNKPKS